jgi:hypothetical protein
MKCIWLRLGNLVRCDALLGNTIEVDSKRKIIQLDQFLSGTGPAHSNIGPRDFAFTITELAAKIAANAALLPCLKIAAEELVTIDVLLAEWNVQCRTPTPWKYRLASEIAIETVSVDMRLLSKVSPKTLRGSDAIELVSQVSDVSTCWGDLRI